MLTGVGGNAEVERGHAVENIYPTGIQPLDRPARTADAIPRDLRRQP